MVDDKILRVRSRRPLRSIIFCYGDKPVLIVKFHTGIATKENQSRQYFGSFEELRKHIRENFINITIQSLKPDKRMPVFRRGIFLFFYKTVVSIDR